MTAWSRERPTKPGWYWWREEGRQPVIIHVVRCGEIIQQPLLANFASGRRRYLSDLAGEFQGPLEPKE